MRKLLLAVVIAVHFVRAAPPPAAPKLAQYAGTWKITRASASGKTEELKNTCVSVGTFYVCQQSSNGNVSGLLVFAPTSQPNRFNTQNILPDGRATGKGELTTDGNTWVFTITWNGGGPLTRYRTTNVFANATTIRFQQEESTDGVHWKTKDSGDEIRISR